MRPSRREALLIAIAKARGWVDELVNGRVGSFAMLARREGKAERHIRLRTRRTHAHHLKHARLKSDFYRDREFPLGPQQDDAPAAFHPPDSENGGGIRRTTDGVSI